MRYKLQFKCFAKAGHIPLARADIPVETDRPISDIPPFSLERHAIEDKAWEDFYAWLEKNPDLPQLRSSGASWFLDSSDENFLVDEDNIVESDPDNG